MTGCGIHLLFKREPVLQQLDFVKYIFQTGTTSVTYIGTTSPGSRNLLTPGTRRATPVLRKDMSLLLLLFLIFWFFFTWPSSSFRPSTSRNDYRIPGIRYLHIIFVVVVAYGFTGTHTYVHTDYAIFVVLWSFGRELNNFRRVCRIGKSRIRRRRRRQRSWPREDSK